MLVLAVSMVGI